MIEKCVYRKDWQEITEILTVIWDKKMSVFKTFLCAFARFLQKQKVLFYHEKN